MSKPRGISANPAGFPQMLWRDRKQGGGAARWSAFTCTNSVQQPHRRSGHGEYEDDADVGSHSLQKRGRPGGRPQQLARCV